MTILRRIPQQRWVRAGSVGILSRLCRFWSCGLERPLVCLGCGPSSSDRRQTSATLCTLENPLNLVSGPRDLMPWPPRPNQHTSSPVALA